MAATHHLQLRPKSDLALFYGLANMLIREGWIDRKFIDAHTTGFDDFAAFVRRFRPAGVALRDRYRHRGAPRRRAERIHDAEARVVLVDDGRQPELRGDADGPGDHQPGPDDRQHRAARHRGELRSPASATRWARGSIRTRRACWAGTTSPIPEHREKVAKALGIPVETIPDVPSLAYDEIIAGVHSRQDQGPLGHRDQPRAFVDRPERAARCPRQARFPRRAGHVLLDRDGPHGRPDAARRRLGREGGDVHQLRAPHRRHQEGAPRARSGPLGLQHLQAGRALLRLRRDVRRLGHARGRLRLHEARLRRPAVRHHRHRRIQGARRGAAASSGPTRPSRRTRHPSAGCSPTGSSSTPMAARNSCSRTPRPSPSRRTRNTRSSC